MPKALAWLIPTVIAPEEPLTPEELARLSEAVTLYLNQNNILKAAYPLVVGIANILPLFLTGRTLRRSRPDKRQEFLDRLHFSRAFIWRGLATLIGLPVKMVYYSQEAEQERLGFNSRELKKEADMRLVSRT